MVVSEPAFHALRFDVEAADAERWSDRLLDAGALSVDAADPHAGTPDEAARFDEPDAAAPQWWPVTRLTALCNAGDAEDIVDAASHALGRPRPACETFVVPARDWVRAHFVLAGELAEGRFDVIVANILANPLRLLAPALAARANAGGSIALSGILDAQADDVIAAYAPWFDVSVEGRDDGWTLLAGARRADA
jgi:ribosomal protein L11 methylase PrmA